MMTSNPKFFEIAMTRCLETVSGLGLQIGLLLLDLVGASDCYMSVLLYWTLVMFEGS
jgi:hypothetical protein